MTRPVYFSEKASQRLDSIFTYLEKNWPKQVKLDFIQKLDKAKKIISKYPDSFPESNIINGLFKCVITKHNSLYYRIKTDEIEIVNIFDNRQKPSKLIKQTKYK